MLYPARFYSVSGFRSHRLFSFTSVFMACIFFFTAAFFPYAGAEESGAETSVAMSARAQKRQREYDGRMNKLKTQLDASVRKAEQAVAEARQRLRDSETELAQLKAEMIKYGLLAPAPEPLEPAEQTAAEARIAAAEAAALEEARVAAAEAARIEAEEAARVAAELAAAEAARIAAAETAAAEEARIAELRRIYEEVYVAVTGFRFTGNNSIPGEELTLLVEHYIGKTLNLRQLNEAADEITLEYRRRGLTLAKAYLPAQETEDGVFEIAVLEGRIGEIKVEGNINYAAEFILAHLLSPDKATVTGEDGEEIEAEQGSVFNNRQLERSLLLLNTEYPDLKVSAVLEPGAETGTVDIRAIVEDEKPLHATLSYNNFGSEYTSKHRAGLQLDWTNAVIPGAFLSAGHWSARNRMNSLTET